jgi:hypothetical protein
LIFSFFFRNIFLAVIIFTKYKDFFYSMNGESSEKNVEGQEKKKPPGQKKHGNTGKPRPPEVRQKISAAHKGKKKNYTPWLKGRTGENHPAYKHGLSEGRYRAHEADAYSAWVQGVHQIWSFRCALTGVDGPLEAHHLNAWNAFPDQRYDLANGVLLSTHVHKQFHALYGNGGNTRAQFYAFVEQYWKNAHCEWNKREISAENHQPNLTLEQVMENQKTYRETAFQKFLDFAKERGHEYVSGTYENIKSEVCIYCPKHDFTATTTFYNYKRAKTGGIECCGQGGRYKKRNPSVRDKKQVGSETLRPPISQSEKGEENFEK